MSNSQRNLLLNGYIREIKELLSKDTIIPTDIIKICSLFFMFSQKVFMHADDKIKSSGGTVRNLHVLDLQSKTVSKLVEHKKSQLFSTYHPSNSHCYIPNIGQYLDLQNNRLFFTVKIDPKKSYDAIICAEDRDINQSFQKTNKQRCPSLLLFESKKIDNNAIEYYKCSSTFIFDEFAQLICCGKQYGVIYERNGALYQCGIKRIIRSANFNFKNISDDAFWKDIKYTDNSSKIQLKYLANDTIFAIQRTGPTLGFKKDSDPSLKCAIFDLSAKKWKEISDFIVQTRPLGILDIFFSKFKGICYDEYKGNIVYVVGNHGDVAQYDLIKDKWKYWSIKQKIYTYSSSKMTECWMESQYTLCFSNGDWFGNIDIRKQDDESAEWCKMESITKLVNNSCGYKPVPTIFF